MQNERKDSKRKGFYLVLALFVALIIWFYVDEFGVNGGPRYAQQRYEDIPIEYVHEEALLDRGLMLVEDGSDQTIDLKLEAPRRRIADIDRDNIHIVVDLEDVSGAGQQSLRPNISYNGFGLFDGQRISISQSMIKEITPFNAAVNIKELNSKQIDVRCELRGTVGEGYTAGQLRMSDTSIEIWGQAEDIDPVSYAKVILDIGQDADNSISESLPIRFYDENHEELDGRGIRSTIQEVKVSMPVSVTKELRLAVKFLEAPGARVSNIQCEFEPKSIMVSGDASKLNGIDSIILAELDLLELKNSGSASYTYPITVPEGCSNLSGVTRATMKISFKDMTSTQVMANQFRYENLPDGKTASILTEEMTVAIFGLSADVDAVSTDQITLVADLGDYGAASGSYTVPAKIEFVDCGDIGVTGTYDLKIVIRDSIPQDETDDSGEQDPEAEENMQEKPAETGEKR